MAKRPVFYRNNHVPFYSEEMVTFEFHPGFAECLLAVMDRTDLAVCRYDVYDALKRRSTFSGWGDF